MKYELMRMGSAAWKRSIYLDLYNYQNKKNVEIHYSTNCQTYDKEKLDKIMFQKIKAREQLTIDEWDAIVESCRKSEDI